MDDPHFLATIAHHDCAVVCIEANEDTPPFAFSVGLFQRFQHPELLIMGLSHDAAQQVINACRDRIRGGDVLRDGFSYGPILADRRIAMRAIHPDHHPGYLGTARWFYEQHPFPALQAFWPDASGRYPWDQGCEPGVAACQPRLDHPWPFTGEPVTKRIWLDRRALASSEPLLRIDRLDASEWRFSCDPGATAMYDRAALWQVLHIDPTVAIASRMPVGGTLLRNTPEERWGRLAPEA